MAKKTSYVWNDKLDLDKLPKTRICKFCGQKTKLLPINENIVFWIHTGKQLEKCTTIMFKTCFVKYFYNAMMEKKKRLTEQIPCPSKT